jgi:hypothetical protein
MQCSINLLSFRNGFASMYVFFLKIQNSFLRVCSFCSATEIGLPIRTFNHTVLTKTSDGNFAGSKVH